MDWFRGVIRGKTRIALAWVFVVLLGFFAREYPSWPGLILCFLGACLRFWASGYLKKDRHPAVGGPYRWMRNPLYFGTFAMAVGTVWSIENWPLLGATVVLFAGIYHFIILDEEEKLQRIFEKPYHEYCRLVPRFWPAVLPPSKRDLLSVNPNASDARFSMSLALENKAYEAFAAFAGMVGFVYAASLLWKIF